MQEGVQALEIEKHCHIGCFIILQNHGRPMQNNWRSLFLDIPMLLQFQPLELFC